MTEGAVIAISATVAALVGPILMLWLTHLNNRKAKEQEYNRQDELAERLERLNVRTEQIHGLVNSSMTAAIQGKLVAERALYVLQAERINPSKKQQSEMEATAARIVDIEETLKNRIKADEDAKKDAHMAVESEDKT